MANPPAPTTTTTTSMNESTCTIIDMRTAMEGSACPLDAQLDELITHRREEILTEHGARIRLHHQYPTYRNPRSPPRKRADNHHHYQPSHNALADCTCLATCCHSSAIGLTTRATASRWRLIRRCCVHLNNPNRYWLVQDACGLSALFITWLLMLFAATVLNILIFMPALTKLSARQFVFALLNQIFYHLIALLALYSHIKAAVTNPGAIRIANCTPELIETLRAGEVALLCSVCRSIKLDRSHHCSVCNRCIRKMDHHCPWINNCVGIGNQKFFILFTTYICLMSFYSLGLIGFRLYECSKNDWTGCNWTSPASPENPTAPIPLILMVFVAFESLLFGLFTLIMTCSQLAAVCSDQTGIESLQRSSNATLQKKNSWKDNLKSVFGEPVSIKWLSPFHQPGVTSETNEGSLRIIACS